MRIIQQFNRDLNNESNLLFLTLDPRSTKIQYYEQFLKVLGGKLDQLNHLNNDEKQINISFLGKRPHSFSEDNIMTDLRYQIFLIQGSKLMDRLIASPAFLRWLTSPRNMIMMLRAPQIPEGNHHSRSTKRAKRSLRNSKNLKS